MSCNQEENEDSEGNCWKNGVITKKINERLQCDYGKRREGNLCY
jgi:hypothetical protein